MMLFGFIFKRERGENGWKANGATCTRNHWQLSSPVVYFCGAGKKKH